MIWTVKGRKHVQSSRTLPRVDVANGTEIKSRQLLLHATAHQHQDKVAGRQENAPNKPNQAVDCVVTAGGAT